MNPYFQHTILNADPVALTVMVYQKGITSIREARVYLREGQIRERSEAIMRAYAAIVELLTTLRPENAPGIGESLGALYTYMMERLIEANMKQSDGPLEEVLNLLVTLSEAWNGVAAMKRMEITESAVQESSGLIVADRWRQSASVPDQRLHLALTA